MAEPAANHARHDIGIDLGGCLTKLAVTGAHPWAGSTATDSSSPTTALDRLMKTARVSGGRAALAVRPDQDGETVPKLLEILHSRYDFDALEAVDSHLAVLADLVAEGAADPDVTYLVCDVGSSTISAALCSAQDTGLRLIADRRVPEQRPGPAELLNRALAELALGRSNDIALERVRAEFGRRHERAGLVLESLATRERYAQTPVFFPAADDGARPIVGGEFAHALAPLAETVQTMVLALVRDCHDPLPTVHVLPTGGLGQLRPVWQAMTDALPSSSRPVVRRTRLTSAARGAAALVTGQVTFDQAPRHSLRLRTHQIRSGLLATVDVTMARAGEPAPGWLTVDGRPLTVTVGERPAGPLLEVSEAGTGPWLPLGWAAGEVPAGRYRVGHFTGRRSLGVLVLKNLSGGSTISVPLGDPSDANQRTR
jgi:hypothetical protein